jgi:hypothetical protein
MKPEAADFSKTLVPIYQTTQHHIPEGDSFNTHHRESHVITSTTTTTMNRHRHRCRPLDHTGGRH